MNEPHKFCIFWCMGDVFFDSITLRTASNLVPRAFPLKKWVGREKALASAGHVSSRTP